MVVKQRKYISFLLKMAIYLGYILLFVNKNDSFVYFIKASYTTDVFFNKMNQYLQFRTTDTLLRLFNKHCIYFFFLINWHALIPPSMSMPHYRYWFFPYLLLKWFSFFKFNLPLQKFVMKNNFRIIAFIITIIKISLASHFLSFYIEQELS